MILRPLPYKEADRLVVVSSVNQASGIDTPYVGAADYLEWKGRKIFDRIAATNGWDAYLSDGAADPQQVLGLSVSEDYFSILGLSPIRGRTLQSSDFNVESYGESPCVISDRLWRQRYGGDPEIVGKRLRLFGKTSFTIVGVMPPGALLPDDRDIVLPFLKKHIGSVDLPRKREWMYISVLARLALGKTPAQTDTELSSVARILEKNYPEYYNGWSNRAVPLHVSLVEKSVRTSLLIAIAAVALVLLIATINIASLQLARGVSRTQEAALRMALGANQWHLFRLLLIENSMLATLGGVLGIALAVGSVSLLAKHVLPVVPGWAEIKLSVGVLVFSFVLTLSTALICGLLPALQTARTAAKVLINESAQQVISSHRGQRLHKALIVVEVALSLVLLVGAGLMIHSLVLAQRPDPGFPVERLLTVDIRLPKHRYGNDTEVVSFYRQLKERLDGVPGVSGVAVTSTTPNGQDRYVERFFQRENSADSPDYSAKWSVVSPGFFKTMGIELIAGRDFSERDIGANSPIIVSEAFARRAFPHGEAVGKRLRSWLQESQSSDGQMVEIVGVVRNVRYFGREEELGDLVYTANIWPWMLLTVRTQADPAMVAGAIRAQIKALDPELAVTNMKTMSDVLDQSVASRRSNTLVLTIFSAVAMALTAIGLYGLLSYTVAQRVREIGLRMTLGASPLNILTTIAGQGIRLVLLGGALGLIGAFGLTRLMSGLLYKVNAVDPISLTVSILFLIVVASIACYVPARRATKLDPLAALRAE